MGLASISQSLKSRFEGYIPQLSSPEAIVLTGATLAYQLYQKNLTGTLLTGTVFVTAIYLGLKEKVTFHNVENHLKKLEQDIATSLEKNDFNYKKAMFIRRFDRIRNILAKNTRLIPKDSMHFSAQRMIQIRDLLVGVRSLKMEIEQARCTGSLLQLKGDFQNRLVNLRNAKLSPSQQEIAHLQEMYKTLGYFPVGKKKSSLPDALQIRGLRKSILNFLNPVELARVESVSSCFYHTLNTPDAHFWKEQYHRFFPKTVPEKNYKQAIIDFYSTRVFGNSLYEIFYGVDVGSVPPIPRKLIKKTDALILVPEYFHMTISADSPLGLNSHGMLTESPAHHCNRPSSTINGKRVLKIPVTLNNLDFLSRRLREEIATGIATAKLNRTALDWFGNVRYPSHWSGQKIMPMGEGRNYAEQQTIALQAGLDVVPTLDRILFDILYYFRTKKEWGVDSRLSSVRTADVTRDGRIVNIVPRLFEAEEMNVNNPVTSAAMTVFRSIPVFRLGLQDDSRTERNGGVAVGLSSN